MRARSLAAVVVVAGATLVGGACASDSVETPPIVYDAEMLLGGAPASGEGFLELDDGTGVDLVPGAQGGFHVWVNMRLHGLEGEVMVVREARRVRDGALVLRLPATSYEVPADAMEDWWESPDAAPAFMCPSPLGINIIDEEIEITVRLESESGDEIYAEDTIVVVPTCNLQADFCQSICSG